MVRTGLIAAVVLATVVLAGCTGTPPVESVDPEVSETATAEASELANLDGEWVATRTVVEGNASSEVYTVGYTEERLLAFSTSSCGDTCVGTALSGTTLDGRTEVAFEQSDSVITFQFTGFNDCLDVETGALLYADGYEYILVYELTVDSSDGSSATALTGTASNLYTAIPEALTAGCQEGTGRILYDVTAIRA